MSHLIIEQGKKVGTEVSVPDAGMKFGRSPANDLVLEDEAVMLFHGRFFFKSDGSLWVTDFGAGEKTTVGGNPIDEYQVKVGDLVEVGATAFRVISAKQAAEAAPVVRPVETSASTDEIDLGFGDSLSKKSEGRKHNEKEEGAQTASLTNRFMQVLVSLLVVCVIIYVALEAMKLSEPTTTQVAPPKNTLALSYERVQADTDNIFRYHLNLNDQGHFSVVVDDLKNNRHVKKEKTISEPMMLQLASQLDDTDFFESGSDHVGIADGQYDLYDLTIKRNRRYHHIKVLNRQPPQEIKRATSIIEDFAKSEVRILFTFLKTPEELRRYAEQSFQLGEARFAERELRHSNLAEAITNYQEAMLYLGTFEPKPVLFSRAKEGLANAIEIRDVKYDDFMFKADRAMRLKDWKEAEQFLKILSELIPDRDDSRYDTIRSKMLTVEKHLR